MPEFTLYHCDCFDFIPSLPDNSLDLVVTDPPYRLGSCAGGGLYKPIKGPDEDNPYKRKETDSVFELKRLDCAEFNATKFLNLIKSKLKKFYGYFFCNKALIPEYLNFAVENRYSFDILTMFKKKPIPGRNNHFLPDTEYSIMIRESGTYWAKDAKFDDYRKVYEVPYAGKKLHPAEKPVDFLERFVRVSCPKGGVIFDPFTGSGSTGIAALLNKCNFIGCEKDDKYFDLANNRLIECEKNITGMGTLFEGLK